MITYVPMQFHAFHGELGPMQPSVTMAVRIIEVQVPVWTPDEFPKAGAQGDEFEQHILRFG